MKIREGGGKGKSSREESKTERRKNPGPKWKGRPYKAAEQAIIGE